MQESNIRQRDPQNDADNPLIWPLLTIICDSQKSHKIHELAYQLQGKGLLPDLDKDPNKALFKRNFLLMNALYQLQALLLPERCLQVQAMDIQLLIRRPRDIALMFEQDVALRSYYLDWRNFDTNSEEIEALFTRFWTSYNNYIGHGGALLDKTEALHILQLDKGASLPAIRRQWRKLALKWHPDRSAGNVAKFREICEAWQLLRR